MLTEAAVTRGVLFCGTAGKTEGSGGHCRLGSSASRDAGKNGEGSLYGTLLGRVGEERKEEFGVSVVPERVAEALASERLLSTDELRVIETARDIVRQARYRRGESW